MGVADIPPEHKFSYIIFDLKNSTIYTYQLNSTCKEIQNSTPPPISISSI